MESLGGDDGRRRRAQAILGASDGTMQFTTLQSPQKQEQQQRQHEEELPQAVAAETKSAPVDNNQEDDEEEAITTFWNLHDEVERLKEAQDIQVRDGVQANIEDQDDGDGETEEQYDIHYGENTGSSLGIFILPSDEDHSSSVSVDELRGDDEEKTPSSPYHIFHGKQSEENTATGNYGSYGGGSSSSPPKGSGGSSSSSGGAGSSSSNNSDGISPEESQLRDVLTNVKELGSNVNIAIHQKTSSEKNGVNDPLRAPGNFDFYNPGGGGPLPGTGSSNGGETIAPPRGNDGPTSQPTFFGKRNCKATNGSFGDNRQERSGGGVTLKFRYELNTDATPGGPYQRASLYNEILPALEDSMTTMMLPAFFSDECMKISGSVGRRKVIRGRFLRGGGGGNEDQVQLFDGLDLFEEDPTLRYQHQHRRLNRVIGIDSDPMDFPLNGERCFGGYSPPNPTIVPKCYVMEGSMTVYFPENFDFKNLVTGTQLTALNTIKEGMEFGTIAEMAHPAILDLTFLESSYSLRPIIPGESVPQAVAPETKDAGGGGGGNVGLIVGIICVLVIFVIIAGCFFRYRLKQEQAKLDAMMRNNTSKKEKKKKKKKGSDIDDEDDDDSDRSSDGTPSDPTSHYILNRYANEMGDADDEDNLTDREKEIHQRLKKRRKVKKKMRRASYASNLSSNHDGSFSTLDTDSDLMGYYASMGASGTTGSKTTTSSDSTTENSGTSGSESSTTSHSQTFHTTSTGTSEHTTSDSGTTSSGGTTSDSDDDSEEEDAFDMNNEHFNVGAAGMNTFSNGAMKGQSRKKKGQKSNLIMTGVDDDGSVGTEATGATEAISNVNRGGNRGRGFGGASAAPSVDFSAATEAMGNVGRNRNNGASEYGGGGFSGGASAAPSVDFSAATEAMGNVGRNRNNGASEYGGGGFSGGASAAPSVDFSAATEAMGNVGRGRNNGASEYGGGGFSGGASAAVSVDFSAATEAMGNVGRGKKKSGGGFSGGGSAGPGASVAMSAATEAIKNIGRGRKPQQMESIGELTFSDF